jgi:hypothetical protein
MAVMSCRSGAVEAAAEAAEAGQFAEAGFAEAPLCGEVLPIEGERWSGRDWSARPPPLLPAAIVIRTFKIAAPAPTMVAAFIQGAQSSEGALPCEAELRSEAGVLPVVVDAVVEADGNHSGRLRLPDWSSIETAMPRVEE